MAAGGLQPLCHVGSCGFEGVPSGRGEDCGVPRRGRHTVNLESPSPRVDTLAEVVAAVREQLTAIDLAFTARKFKARFPGRFGGKPADGSAQAGRGLTLTT